MVRLVRLGKSMHAVAARLHVDPSTVCFWVARAKADRLDRIDFSDRKSGRAWNRTASHVEQRIVALRRSLREESILGEYGARAIEAVLNTEMPNAPSQATLNRVLARLGLQDGGRRGRRPAPPPGWYLPQVAAGDAGLAFLHFL